eukprot:gene15117-biopygen1543
MAGADSAAARVCSRRLLAREGGVVTPRISLVYAPLSGDDYMTDDSAPGGPAAPRRPRGGRARGRLHPPREGAAPPQTAEHHRARAALLPEDSSRGLFEDAPRVGSPPRLPHYAAPPAPRPAADRSAAAAGGGVTEPRI